MMEIKTNEENIDGSLYLSVFDLVSDAVLIYTAEGLYKANNAALNLLDKQIDTLTTNTPFALCDQKSKQLTYTEQWDYIKLNIDSLTGKTYTFHNGLLRSFNSSVSIKLTNVNGQAHIIFVLTQLQPCGKNNTLCEARIESFINTFPFEIWVVDSELKTILQNKVFVDHWGKFNDLETKKESDSASDRELWSKKYNEVLSTGKTLDCEQVKLQQGHRVVMREVLAPLTNSQGKAIGVIGINIDVTHLKSVEQSLLESESRYRTVMELSGSIVYEFLIAEQKLTWQGPVEQLTGFSLQEFESMGYEQQTELIHPDDRETVIRAFENAIQHHTPIRHEFRYRKKNGDYLAVEEFGYVFYNEQNIPYKIIGSKRDISERKEAELRMQESELRYRKLFETANDAIFVIEDKYVVDCNPKAISVFERDKDQLVGMYALTYSCEIQANGQRSFDAITEILERVKTGESCIYEWRLLRPDGSVFDAELSVSMVELPGREVIFAIVRDVTARNALQQQLVASETRYRKLFDTMFNGFIVMSPVFDAEGTMIDAVYLDVNPYYIKLVGKPLDQIIGHTISQITGAVPVWINHYESVYKTGTSASFQDYHPKFKKHFRVKVFKPTDDCFAVMFDDVTQHVLAENLIHENQKKYQMLFDHMHSACSINTPYYNDEGKLIDFEYVEVNNSYETHLGVPVERLRGKRISQLLTDYDRSWLELYEQVMKTGKAVNIEKYSVELKRYFRVNVFKQSEHYFATLLDDITDIKRTEQQIIDTIVEVEERERRQLASDLHDDIGPQLVSMRLYLTTLARMGLSDSQKEIHQTIIELLDQTITSVRAISANLSPALLQKFGLAAAINAECDHARVLFSVDFTHNLQKLRFNTKTEAMLYRILKELLNNTKKYAEATHVTLNITYLTDTLTMVYSDNGKGFDYNKTIGASHTGMGLANIDMRVKSINGSSSFTRNPLGSGIQFELSVPIDFSQVKIEQFS